MNQETLSGFLGKPEKIPIGFKFEAFDNGEIEANPGDVVVWYDPDAGQHAGECEFIHESIYVGFVKGVYAVDYSFEEGYSVELDTTMPLGRIDIDGPYTAVIGENYRGEIPVIGKDATQRYADRFLNSDYDYYYHEDWHSGEDGIPENLWELYEESSHTGPGCPYCRGEIGQDGLMVSGE